MRTLSRAADRDDVLRRVAMLRPDSARRWGRMTPPQMVCHLADSFRMATGERPVPDRSSLLGRTIVKWVALYAPMPWPAGRIRTVPEVDQEGGGTCPRDFDGDRADLLSRVTAFPAATVEAVPHPVFGRMSRGDWMRWAWLHCDHHLRQFGV